MRRKDNIVGQQYGNLTVVAVIDSFYADFKCNKCKQTSTLLTFRAQAGETTCEHCSKNEITEAKAKVASTVIEGVTDSYRHQNATGVVKAFEQTVDAYIAAYFKPVIGACQNDPEAKQNSLRRGIVSDFICEIETQAKRALTPDQVQDFFRMIRKRANAALAKDEKYPDSQTEKYIQQTLGYRFRRLGLSDYRVYASRSKRLTAGDRVRIENDIADMKKDIAQAETLGEKYA